MFVRPERTKSIEDHTHKIVGVVCHGKGNHDNVYLARIQTDLEASSVQQQVNFEVCKHGSILAYQGLNCE